MVLILNTLKKYFSCAIPFFNASFKAVIILNFKNTNNIHNDNYKNGMDL
jgi:hypothetical protein